MHFVFTLDSWNIDFWDIDLLDTDLDLLVGHAQIQISPVNILFTFKTSSRRLEEFFVFQDVFKTSCEVSSRRICKAFSAQDILSSKTSLRHLEDVFKTSLRRFARYLKTSSRCLQDVLDDEKLLRWRRVLKTSWRRLEDQQVFAGLVNHKKQF